MNGTRLISRHLEHPESGEDAWNNDEQGGNCAAAGQPIHSRHEGEKIGAMGEDRNRERRDGS